MSFITELSDFGAQSVNGGRHGRGTDVSARGQYAVAAGMARDVYQNSSVNSFTVNGGRLTANDYGVIGIYA